MKCGNANNCYLLFKMLQNARALCIYRDTINIYFPKSHFRLYYRLIAKINRTL